MHFIQNFSFFGIFWNVFIFIFEAELLDLKLEYAKINLKPSKYSENSSYVKKTVSGNDNFFRIKIAEQELTG